MSYATKIRSMTDSTASRSAPRTKRLHHMLRLHALLLLLDERRRSGVHSLYLQTLLLFYFVQWFPSARSPLHPLSPFWDRPMPLLRQRPQPQLPLPSHRPRQYPFQSTFLKGRGIEPATATMSNLTTRINGFVISTTMPLQRMLLSSARNCRSLQVKPTSTILTKFWNGGILRVPLVLQPCGSIPIQSRSPLYRPGLTPRGPWLLIIPATVVTTASMLASSIAVASPWAVSQDVLLIGTFQLDNAIVGQ
mmetsp:Transcript_21337/g.43842  ORF Transcript_21337/g.43842 Transcript_21337/m.43842 type:complete len:249 (-) Transcript_21337:4368-5114(-)